MKRSALIIALAGVVVAAAVWTLVPAGTHAPAQPASPTAPAMATTHAAHATTASVTPAAAGYVVFLDGKGKVTTEPQSASDAQFNAEVAKMFNTSSAGLHQVTTANGVTVNLEGRFMSAMVATKDAEGNVVVPCLTNENDVKAFEQTRAAGQAAKKE